MPQLALARRKFRPPRLLEDASGTSKPDSSTETGDSQPHTADEKRQLASRLKVIRKLSLSSTLPCITRHGRAIRDKAESNKTYATGSLLGPNNTSATQGGASAPSKRRKLLLPNPQQSLHQTQQTAKDGDTAQKGMTPRGPVCEREGDRLEHGTSNTAKAPNSLAIPGPSATSSVLMNTTALPGKQPLLCAKSKGGKTPVLRTPRSGGSSPRTETALKQPAPHKVAPETKIANTAAKPATPAKRLLFAGQSPSNSKSQQSCGSDPRCPSGRAASADGSISQPTQLKHDQQLDDSDEDLLEGLTSPAVTSSAGKSGRPRSSSKATGCNTNVHNANTTVSSPDQLQPFTDPQLSINQGLLYECGLSTPPSMDKGTAMALATTKEVSGSAAIPLQQQQEQPPVLCKAPSSQISAGKLQAAGSTWDDAMLREMDVSERSDGTSQDYGMPPASFVIAGCARVEIVRTGLPLLVSHTLLRQLQQPLLPVSTAIAVTGSALLEVLRPASLLSRLTLRQLPRNRKLTSGWSTLKLAELPLPFCSSSGEHSMSPEHILSYVEADWFDAVGKASTTGCTMSIDSEVTLQEQEFEELMRSPVKCAEEVALAIDEAYPGVIRDLMQIASARKS